MKYNPAVLFDPRAAINLPEYGIEIPALDSRATTTLQGLFASGHLTQETYIGTIEEKLTRKDLLRVHSPAFVENLLGPGAEKEIIRTFELIDAQGNPYRYAPAKAKEKLSGLVSSLILQAEGTLQAGKTALDRGFCYYLGGGMHHAQYDHGAGFCLINDMVLAAKKLLAEKLVSRVWIIDLDAHKGDGTAALCRGSSEILTLSIHMAEGWPLDKETIEAAGADNPSLIPSTVDIPIGQGEEKDYLPKLKKGLEELKTLSSASTSLSGLPGLAFVVDGSDPYEKDALPSSYLLNLTENEMLERDLMVQRFLKELGIPSAWVMAGGYGEDSWRIYYQFLERVLRESRV